MQRFISPEGNFKKHDVWLEQELVQGFDVSPGFGLEIQFYQRMLNIWSSHQAQVFGLQASQKTFLLL